MTTSGLDTTSFEDDAFDTEAAIDRCILRLIARCCNCDKLVRATELARLLTLEKSLKGAIKLASALKLPALAERFNGILEERLSEECGAEAAQNVNTITCNKSIADASTVSNIAKQESMEEKLTAKAQESNKNTNIVNSTNPFAKVPNDRGKPEDKEETVKTLKGSELNLKASGVGATSVGSNGARPTNPFAKTSNNQGNSSLIDSIKKMRKAEHEKSEIVGILEVIDGASNWHCKSGKIPKTLRFDPKTSRTCGLFIAKI